MDCAAGLLENGSVMPDLFVKYQDGKSEIVKNVNGAGFEGDKLLVLINGTESHMNDVRSFKFDYRDINAPQLDHNEITQD